MLPYRCFLFLAFLYCSPAFLTAQIDTLLDLPLVEIAEQPIRTQTVGGRTQSWSKADLQSHPQTNLAEWLDQEGGVFIKSYGNGSIATTSIRGGSAAHTSVLWNGLPIQSPMLGQLDFSLFPIGFIDQVQLHYGGNSAAWGSGAIGGVVDLRNQLRFDSSAQLHLHSTIGSFGFRDNQLQTAYNNGRWGLHTRLFYRQADNDFPYQLRPDLPEKKQTNAALQQLGLMQSLFWKPQKNQELAVHLWAQQSDREIPPTTVQNESLATQADEFLRSAIHWKMVQTNTIWQARLGLFREIIDFQDEQILLQARTGFWTARAEVEGTRAWNKDRQLHFGISHSWSTAQADAYAASPQQNRTAPFLSYRHQAGGWRFQFNLRQEIVDGHFLPTIPGLGIEHQLSSTFSIQAKLSRNYRLPTLNDLYWQPGGNRQLLPESGWSQEGGLKLQQLHGPQNWSYQLTVFNRNINNWILWSKPAGQSFWSSNNITEVWSRGLEQRLRWTWQTASWQVQLSAGYDYIRSTNQVAVSNPKLEEGVQLVYVPEHQAFGQLRYRRQGLELQYRHTYTGSVQSLNDGPLPAYQLGYFSGAYQIQFPNWNTRLFFQLNNLWDQDYRVIERQVMPGRHFQLGLQIQIHKKHQTL